MDGALGIFEGEIPRENEASRAFRSWWHYHARMESQVSFEHEMTYATSAKITKTQERDQEKNIVI